MIAPQFTITSDDRNLVSHFEQLPVALRANLRVTITDLVHQLLGRVRAGEPVRTGLLRSRTAAFVDETTSSIRGRVRILPTGRAQRVAAAFGALEYGAHSRVPVQSYRRQGIAVAAYERRANITELRFLRGPAQAMRARVITEIEAAVQKSVEDVR